MCRHMIHQFGLHRTVTVGLEKLKYVRQHKTGFPPAVINRTQTGKERLKMDREPFYDTRKLVSQLTTPVRHDRQ